MPNASVKPIIVSIKKPIKVASAPAHESTLNTKVVSKKLDERPKQPESPEKMARTIFVGNVSTSVVKSKKLQRSLKGLFEAYGAVESLRFRSLIGDNVPTKRIAYITGKINEERLTCNVYVVMTNYNDALEASKAANGTIFEGRHLRVDLALNAESKPATKKSVFLGNLPLNVDEESLWTIFGNCGPISYIRVIRDRETGVGKGFGYVAFKEKTAVELALQLDGSNCEGRPLRVSKCAKPGYQTVKKARREKLVEVKEKFRPFQIKKKKNDSENPGDSSKPDSQESTQIKSIGSRKPGKATNFTKIKETGIKRLPKLEARSSRPLSLGVEKSHELNSTSVHQKLNNPQASSLTLADRKEKKPLRNGSKAIAQNLGKSASSLIVKSSPGDLKKASAKSVKEKRQKLNGVATNTTSDQSLPKKSRK